jgi:hypothetical protein
MRQCSYALSLHTRAITTLQEQASTGNRVNRASDSPSEAYRILGLNTQDRSLAGYIENIQNLIGTLEISSTVIENMASELADSRTVLTEIVGGVYDNEGQERIAEKLNSTLEQLVSLANTKHANQYLFSGNNTSAPPYAVGVLRRQIVSVTYKGARNPVESTWPRRWKSRRFASATTSFKPTNARPDLPRPHRGPERNRHPRTCAEMFGWWSSMMEAITESPSKRRRQRRHECPPAGQPTRRWTDSRTDAFSMSIPRRLPPPASNWSASLEPTMSSAP